jgi:hypothetical protein
MTPRKSPSKQAAQQYDITVKELLQAAPPKLLELVLGAKPAEFLTVEFPKVRLRRPDFLVRTERGDIEQLEVQSDNDDDMEWRMLEYYPLLRKLFGRPPMQRVLYIGQKPLKMVGRIDEPTLQFRYEVIDVRQIDAEFLLKSKSVEDRIMAILCHADNAQTTIRRILHSLTPLPAKIQSDKIEQLLVLSRLRGLTDMVTQEVQRRNALKEILSESKVWMEWIRREAEKEAIPLANRLAEKKAAQIARLAEKKAAQSQRDDRIKLLTRQLETLYGKLPTWANEKIAAAQSRTLEKWMLRLLKAKSLEEVLR